MGTHRDVPSMVVHNCGWVSSSRDGATRRIRSLGFLLALIPNSPMIHPAFRGDSLLYWVRRGCQRRDRTDPPPSVTRRGRSAEESRRARRASRSLRWRDAGVLTGGRTASRGGERRRGSMFSLVYRLRWRWRWRWRRRDRAGWRLLNASRSESATPCPRRALQCQVDAAQTGHGHAEKNQTFIFKLNRYNNQITTIRRRSIFL